MNLGPKLLGKSILAICFIGLVLHSGNPSANAQDSGSLGNRLPWWDEAETQQPQDPLPPPTQTPPQQAKQEKQEKKKKQDPVPEVPPSALDPNVDPFKPQEDQKPDPLPPIDPTTQPGVVQPPPVTQSEDTPILPQMPTPPVYQPPVYRVPNYQPPLYQVAPPSPLTMQGNSPLPPPRNQMGEPYQSSPPLLPGGDYFHAAPAISNAQASCESTNGFGLRSRLCGCDMCRGLEIFADSLFLSRETTSDQVLIRQGSFDPTGNPLLSSGDMNMDSGTGLRAGFVSCGPRGTFEFVFTAINSWNRTEIINDPTGPISSAYPNILLSNFDTSRFSWDADFNSAEFNIHRCNNNVTWIGGVRWIELSELLQNDINFPNRGALVPTYSIQTDNQLWGVQGGAKLHLWSSPRLRFESVLKGALLGNTAKQSTTSLRGDWGFPAAGSSIQDRGEETSFFGEINLIGDFKIRPRVSLRGGYQLMWLTNVALAPDQIAGNDLIQTGAAIERLGPTGARGINAQGNLFAHGAIFGIEFRR